MLESFLIELRDAKLPVSLKEFLTLMEAMQRGVASWRVDDFYYLARAALVKDEKHLYKFDRVLRHYFKGLENVAGAPMAIPAEWLKRLGEKLLSEEEKRQIEAMGGWDKLMETLQQR